jgi:hypothetical protein
MQLIKHASTLRISSKKSSIPRGYSIDLEYKNGQIQGFLEYRRQIKCIMKR